MEVWQSFGKYRVNIILLLASARKGAGQSIRAIASIAVSMSRGRRYGALIERKSITKNRNIGMNEQEGNYEKFDCKGRHRQRKASSKTGRV